MVDAMKNPLDEYREYLAALHSERETIKEEINARSLRLKEINDELDKEKERTKQMFQMTVRTRKPRKEAAPAAEGTEPVTPKKRGRKSNAEKAAEAQAVTT